MTNVSTRYKIRLSGFDYSNFDRLHYSKYQERLKMSGLGQIPYDEVYGLVQAREHIQEIKDKYFEYGLTKEEATELKFEIIQQIMSEEVIEVV